MTHRGVIAGFGAIARGGHLPRWRVAGDVEIVGLADPRFAPDVRSVEGLPAFRSLDAALDREAPDFVDVCAPPSSHAALARAALERGVHVFCEKPLVVDRADHGEILEAAARSPAVLFTVHNWRHAPILAAIRGLVEVDRLGGIREIEWTVERTAPSKVAGGGPNWRLDRAVAGGGILVDHGWHALYLVLEWLGAMPRRVEATLERRRWTDLDVEDTATATLSTDDATARLFFTWAGDARRNAARLVGSRGRVDLLDDTLRIETEDGVEKRRFAAGLSAGSTHPDWFDATAREFLDEVEGRTPRGTNLSVASACFRLLDAAWRSADAGGRPVEPAARGDAGSVPACDC